MSKKIKRTSAGLRDTLFDELEQLRGPDADPQRAMAVANVAKQIVNIAKVELDFHRETIRQQESGNRIDLGSMQLGTRVTSADTIAVEN